MQLYFCRKPHLPPCNDLWRRGCTNTEPLPEGGNLYYTSGTMTHGRCTRQPPKHLALETSGVSVQETPRAVLSAGSAFTGLTIRLICLRTQYKSTSLKGAQTRCEGVPFANLKASTRRAKAHSDSLQRQKIPEGAIFTLSLPCYCQCWQELFLHSHNLLVPPSPSILLPRPCQKQEASALTSSYTPTARGLQASRYMQPTQGMPTEYETLGPGWIVFVSPTGLE